MSTDTPNPASTIRGVALTLAGVCTACVIVAIGVWVAFQPTAGSVGLEVVKSLLQVGVVAVAGAVISLVTGSYQRKRKRADKAAEDARANNAKIVEAARLAAEKKRDRERAAREQKARPGAGQG